MKLNNLENYKFIHHSFVRACDTALHLLQKASDFVKEKNLNEAEFLTSKLAPDMFDLKRQFQIFTDNVAGAIARGANISKPSMPDTENTISELILRTQKTKEFILNIKPESVENLDSIKIKLPWMGEGMYFDADTYFGDFVIQNAYFHLVTAYGILRSKGMQLGKPDFTGPLTMKKDE